jgi:uncharacterized membrane protein YqaE (UPF0057 family)
MSGGNILLYILALFIPPLPVFFERGLHADFWINIVLWILGWIPGVIHSWYIISKSGTVQKPVAAQYPDVAQNPGAGQYPNPVPAGRTGP